MRRPYKIYDRQIHESNMDAPAAERKKRLRSSAMITHDPPKPHEDFRIGRIEVRPWEDGSLMVYIKADSSYQGDRISVELGSDVAAWLADALAECIPIARAANEERRAIDRRRREARKTRKPAAKTDEQR